MSPKELAFLDQHQQPRGMSSSSNSPSSSLGGIGTPVAAAAAAASLSSTTNNSGGVGSTAAQQQYCLKWNNHQTNLLRAFDRLLQSEAFTDVTLAAEGRSLRAHKVVLSACSSYFETLFEEHPDKSPIIILKDMKFTHVSQLVNFMYRGEINITQDMLAGLLKTAETLKVKGLAEVSGGGAGPTASAGPTPSTLAPDTNPSPSAAAISASVASPHLTAFSQPQSVAAAQAAAAVASMAFKFGQTSNSSASPAASVLTAALAGGQTSSPSPPSLAPLAALLNPQTMDDDRRADLLKRCISSSSNLLSSVNSSNCESSDLKPLEPLCKIARRDTDASNIITSSAANHLLHFTSNSLGSSSSPPPSSMQRVSQQHFMHSSPPHKHQSPSLLHSSHFLNSMTSRSSSSNSTSASSERHTPSKSSNSSPLQAGGLTPLPQELTVNAQQDLPSFLHGYLVFKLNDYLGFRTRQQFWEEPSVRRIMEGIKNKEIDMKTAAELLGVSYGTLYGRYREVFGYLKHSWVNKGGRTSLVGSKENRSIWEESRAQDLILAVLNKELSLTAAAVRLGVDTNTFFNHITDHGKNKQRVAQLMASVACPTTVPSLAGLGILSEHAASLLAEHHGNLDILSSEGHQSRTIDLMTPEHLRTDDRNEEGEEEPGHHNFDDRQEHDDPNVAVGVQDLSMENPPPEDTEELNEDEEVEIEEKPVLEDPSALMVQYESQELLKNGGMTNSETGLSNGEEAMEATEEEEEEDHLNREVNNSPDQIEQGEDLSTTPQTANPQTSVHQALAETEMAMN